MAGTSVLKMRRCSLHYIWIKWQTDFIEKMPGVKSSSFIQVTSQNREYGRLHVHVYILSGVLIERV